MKNEMRCVFQNDVAGQLSLQSGAMRFQFIDHARPGSRPKNTYEDMPVFQVGRNIDVVHSNQRALETDITRNDPAQLTFYELVYA